MSNRQVKYLNYIATTKRGKKVIKTQQDAWELEANCGCGIICCNSAIVLEDLNTGSAFHFGVYDNAIEERAIAGVTVNETPNPSFQVGPQAFSTEFHFDNQSGADIDVSRLNIAHEYNIDGQGWKTGVAVWTEKNGKTIIPTTGFNRVGTFTSEWEPIPFTETGTVLTRVKLVYDGDIILTLNLGQINAVVA